MPGQAARLGFTLAEVLVTLGIIGVIAALTMPSLINSTQNRELQSALNKGYSEISQALEFMKTDIGTDIVPQDYPPKTFSVTYRKYFKSLKTDSNSGIISGEHEDGDNETSAVKAYKNYKTYSLSQTVKTDFFD